MPRSLFALVLAFTLLPSPAMADDWPWWRGPMRDGHADPNQSPPVSFSATENVRWVAEIPGRGHGSATVVGDQVFLAAADPEKETQSVRSLDRKTGQLLWETVVHEGGWPKKANKKASQASSSLACDGERLFISFFNDEAVYATALDLSGKQLWQTKIADYKVHQGYGASPAIYESLVIVSADNKSGKGAICGLDRKTGEIVWKVERPKVPNYASPIILKAAGKTQLVFTGCDLVSSFDPLTGEKIWEIDGATTECVTSTVTDGQHVFTSGGYPKNHVSAVAADGSGKVVWESKERVYVPSMLVKDGYLYGVMDAGIAVCWNAATGEEIWKERLGGTFSSSPVLVGEVIYAANESGDVFVYRADPENFEILAKNRLGDEIYSTPAICGGEIYLRVAEYEGDERREKLYCLAKSDAP